MNRYVLLILAPLVLGGCAELGGAAAAFGVQALTIGGQGTVRAIEQDIAAAQRWTGRHEAAVAIYMQACIEHAQKLAVGTEWNKAEAAFENCLVKSVENMPTLLIERVKMRYDRSFSEKEAQVQPEQ